MEKYQIMDVIDQGAYGIVWKAINKQSSQLVAIKQFKQSDEDQFSRKTIQRQIKMLKMLKGDYVVNIKQAFKKKGKIYLIFQYFQNNLLNLIERYQHGLDPKLINQLIYKIIKCLQYLHSKNIIHRDVKPQNLLINSDYSLLKICDFGFARFMPQKQYDLTEYVATRWYRSPQLLVGQPYGKAADLWAVGCMIGQLVDGQPMFPGDDEIDQIFLINKLVANLTADQQNYFKRNPKFQNFDLPQVYRDETLDLKYLGKIEKNALSFMKACLKMNPAQRMTVQQALKHPYLLKYSLQDNQFTNDEQNLLHLPRKNQIKNDSKVSLISIKDKQIRQRDRDIKDLKDSKVMKEVRQVRQVKEVKQVKVVKEGKDIRDSKIAREIKQLKEIREGDRYEEEHYQSRMKIPNNSLLSKKGLKLQGGSMNERHIPSLARDEDITTFSKKKSHTNLQTLKLDEHLQKPKQKKLAKAMSQEKNLKVNVDVNLKINLKINKKQTEKKDIRQQIQSRLQSKLNGAKHNLLPQIKNNSKGMRYHLNIRHQKANQLISVIGQTKQLIKGSKPNLHS